MSLTHWDTWAACEVLDVRHYTTLHYQTYTVPQFKVCILWRTHLKSNYVTMPREGCPNSKAPSNAAFFSLFFGDAHYYPMWPHISQDSLCARKKDRNVPKAGPSHLTAVNKVNKVSLKDSSLKTTKAESFRGCRPWTETAIVWPQCYSWILALNILHHI